SGVAQATRQLQPAVIARGGGSVLYDGGTGCHRPRPSAHITARCRSVRVASISPCLCMYLPWGCGGGGWPAEAKERRCVFSLVLLFPSRAGVVCFLRVRAGVPVGAALPSRRPASPPGSPAAAKRPGASPGFLLRDANRPPRIGTAGATRGPVIIFSRFPPPPTGRFCFVLCPPRGPWVAGAPLFRRRALRPRAPRGVAFPLARGRLCARGAGACFLPSPLRPAPGDSRRLGAHRQAARPPDRGDTPRPSAAGRGRGAPPLIAHPPPPPPRRDNAAAAMGAAKKSGETARASAKAAAPEAGSLRSCAAFSTVGRASRRVRQEVPRCSWDGRIGRL
ncbi:uncharacterized protein Tco025E_10045, partial [Trypanosoma conorhini]